MPKTPDTADDVLAEVAREALPATDPSPTQLAVDAFTGVAELAGAAAQPTRPGATALYRLILDGIERPVDVTRTGLAAVRATLDTHTATGSDEREAVCYLARKAGKGHRSCVARMPGEAT